MNLSFAGCGFLGIYHVGVAVCFKKYAPHLLLDKISGASAGSLAACCLLCDLPLGELTNDFFRVVNEARSHSLGPFSPSFNIQTCLLEGLRKHLPEDAHKRVSGRLHISLTRVYDGKNVIVSQFNSREDLLQALLCACFIPGFSGILPPHFHGVRYMDGAFSDNLPILDENTVTVSPFCGESDICPRDQSSQLFHVNWANTSIEISKQNINRFARILFPPKPEVLSNICQQGFDDALAFLHRNNLISCTRCVAVQSTFIVSETLQPTDTQSDYDPECEECTKHRKDAMVGDMPAPVLKVFQEYIDSANKGLANWIFRSRGFKILHALSLPATVPADFMFATISKLIKAAPMLRTHVCQLTKFLIEEVNYIMKSGNEEKNSENITSACKINLQKVGQRYSSRQSLYNFVGSNSNNGDTVSSSGMPSIRHNHPSNDYDTFDHILNVTTTNDAIYAYYYMDDKTHKVKVTEIFDITTNQIQPTVNLLDERSSAQRNAHSIEARSWNVSPEELYGDMTENDNFYGSSDNIVDDSESEWPGSQIEEVLSDYSDPEVDQTHRGRPAIMEN